MQHTELFQGITIDPPLFCHPLSPAFRILVFFIALIVFKVQETISPLDPHLTLCCVASNLLFRRIIESSMFPEKKV
jgi:hypothetical protein